MTLCGRKVGLAEFHQHIERLGVDLLEAQTARIAPPLNASCAMLRRSYMAAIDPILVAATRSATNSLASTSWISGAQ
jgi:hypothetical protein